MSSELAPVVAAEPKLDFPAPVLAERLQVLRGGLADAQATRRPDVVLSAARALRSELEAMASSGADIGGELSDTLLLEAEMAMLARAPDRAVAAAERAAALRQTAFEIQGELRDRARLLDALAALARHHLARGDDAAAEAALAAAEPHLAFAAPDNEAWQAGQVRMLRLKAAVAERLGRYDEAVVALRAGLPLIRSDPAQPSTDADAARLQFLVRLARSHLALGQAEAADAGIAECETLLASLEGRMPARAISVLRAAVLGHRGSAAAMLGRAAEANRHFTSALAIVEALGGADLNELQGQILRAQAAAQHHAHDTGGRHAQHEAHVPPSGHVHSATCSCCSH